MATYLLTWNAKYAHSSDDKPLAVGGDIDWPSGALTPLAINDYVYLVRCDGDAQGIFAKAAVRESVSEGTSDGVSNALRLQVLEVRLTCAEGLLPRLLLYKSLGIWQSAATDSGTVVTPETTSALDSFWLKGEGIHSLAQYVAWSRQDDEERCTNWLKNYNEITQQARQVRSGDAPLDDGFLSLLWLERDNGIASLPQGVMPKSEFGQSIERLRELTQQLMSSPDSDQLNQINLAWVEAVKNKTFSTRRPASIHRVLAAITPALYSTLVNESDCQVLLVGLGREFQLRSTAPSRANWCELNHSLKRSFSEAGLDDTDSDTPQALEHNIAMWQLMSALKEKRVSTAEEISFMPSSAQQLGDRPQLNQILYGPPGTGKTHSTVIEALRILEPALLTDPLPERDELFDAFKGYQDAGQVVFCTFHQSFSYEDFVEGIRAETLDGELNYKLESGVFKELCDRAGSGRISANDPFDKAFTVFTAALDNLSGRLSMATVQGNSFDVGYAGTDTFRVFINGAAQSTIRGNVSHVRQLYQTGETQGIYSLPYVRGMLNYLLQHCGLPPYKASKAVAGEQDKFVLIIDEINRGNISRIFGELITLIEPSKRAGAGQGEVSQVILPYSKKPFSVPSNLYLIGTMNTSDRSLVGLDIALRRRFAFKEMPPCPKLLDDVWVESEDLNIGKMLAVMNQRIEVLLDRNHCLGHAYFMELKRSDTPPKLSELAVIFKQKILPLLQEYFFEDWERIGWVLNDQNALENGSQPFVRAPDQETSLQKLFGAKVASNLQDRRWSLNQQAFGSVDNYLNILR